MTIIENFNDESNLNALKDFTKRKKKSTYGSILDNFYSYDLLYTYIDKKIAKIMVDENDNHLFFLDLGKLLNVSSFDEIHSLLKDDPKNRFDKVIDFIKKEVMHVVPNTFFFMSNVDFNHWLDNNSMIKNVLDSYPCYNLITYTNKPVSDGEIKRSNETRKYSFESNVWDQNEFYFNYIDRALRIEEASIIRIAKFPDLLEVFDDYRNTTIPMIFPMNGPLESNPKYAGTGIKVVLDGFKLDLLGSRIYFTSSLGSKIDAMLYPSVDYDTFYDLESSFDLFKVFESVRVYNINNKTYQALFFYSFKALKDNIFDQEKKHIKKDYIPEDRMVSDMYSILPIYYEEYETLKKQKSNDNNFVVNNLITGLNFQENYEFGNENANINPYSIRVERFDLGSIKIYLTEEPHYNYYLKNKMVLLEKEPINIRLIVGVDKETHSGILYLLHLGIKGKPTRYLDEVARNGLVMPYDEEDPYMKDLKVKETEEGKQYVSFYQYINNKFHIKRNGEPRQLILSPYLSDENKVINDLKANNIPFNEAKIHTQYKEIKSSLLYGKALFSEGEELGAIVDNELDEMYKDDWGIAVYEYSTIYVSKCNVLQYADTYKDYLVERIDFAVVNLFYLELIQLEVAAIKNATNSISSFINGYKIKKDENTKNKKDIKNEYVLEQLESIQEEYAKTLDLWNIQTNYLSSKVVLEKMQDKFNIEKDIEYLKRIREEIQTIYQSRQNKIANRTGAFIGIFGILLTLPDLINIYLDACRTAKEEGKKIPFFFDFEINLINWLTGINILRIILIILLIGFGIKMFKENKKNIK